MSEQPKWTPGPWSVIPGKLHAFRICPADFTTLALVYGLKSPPAPDNGESNARLIAAAPELYTALDELAAFTEEYPRWAEVPMRIGHVDLLTKVRAALAKARGTSPE